MFSIEFSSILDSTLGAKAYSISAYLIQRRKGVLLVTKTKTATRERA